MFAPRHHGRGGLLNPGVTMRTIGMSLIATLLAAAPVLAQVRADPGVVIGNRIAVRVNVTLADAETPYSPARDVALAFTRLGADTVIARTDEAGGHYRAPSRRGLRRQHTAAVPVEGQLVHVERPDQRSC